MKDRLSDYENRLVYLVETIQQLSLARNLETIIEIIRKAARNLVQSDGATFILREQNKCYYVDEDAISPLWKGKRFPIEDCVSGWTMLNKQCASIPDIYADERVPADAYRPTFVKSLLMVPIRSQDPIGAIGNYWKETHETTAEEVKVLQMLADCTSIAIENVQLYNDLQRQLERRDEFISLAAHELRTPLTPMMLQLDLFKRKVQSDGNDEIQRFVTASKHQIQQFSRLTENLLDVSRIRLQHFPLELEVMNDITELIQDHVNLEWANIPNIEIKSQKPVAGEWDRLKLHQLLRNLISNAVRYGNSKSIEVEIKETDVDRFQLTVKDHGPGIPISDQKRIFDRFERASSGRNYPGIGLGLYICRQIVESHGGTIWVVSEPGQGSTFVAELPRYPRR